MIIYHRSSDNGIDKFKMTVIIKTFIKECRWSGSSDEAQIRKFLRVSRGMPPRKILKSDFQKCVSGIFNRQFSVLYLLLSQLGSEDGKSLISSCRAF